MLKKAKEAKDDNATTSGAPTKDIADRIMKSSRTIWLAGLGAFAKAQQEGSKVFDTLVQQGEQLEQKTREAAAGTASAAREAAMSKAKEMQQMAGGTWDKLEQVFEDRVSRSLNRLGVITSREVGDLSRQVDELNRTVRELMRTKTAGGGAKKKAGTKKRKARAKAPGAKGATRASRARRA